MPRVTIGMPIYNGERYLACAIESILEQTFTDFELVIADNCSTDASVGISQKFAAADARVRVIQREKNNGAVDNFNFVFKETESEFFKWAAVDDVCSSTYIEKCLQALDDQPQAVWSHCTSDKIDSKGQSLIQQLSEDDPMLHRVNGQLTWKDFPRERYASDSAATRFCDVLLGTTWCVDSYGLIRRTALEKTRLLINTYGAEKVLMGELSLLGKYAHVDEILFAQRIHDEASSSLSSHKKQQEYVGSKQRSFLRTRMGLFWAHLGSVARHRIGFGEKMKAYFAIMRYMLQFGKWSKVFTDFWLKRGVGGGGKRLLEKTGSSQE